MKLSSLAVGVTVADRPGRTLGCTLDSLLAAGFPSPRLFCDGEVKVPANFEVTRRFPAIGGWPNFWIDRACRPFA